MGRDGSAQLLYGYDFGNGENGWKLEGAGEWGEFPEVPWFDEDTSEYTSVTIDAIEEYLAKHYGVNYFWQKEKELGITFEICGVMEWGSYILSAKRITNWDDAIMITPELLTVDPSWDEKLQEVLDILGVKPLQEKPAWFATYSYG